MKNIIAFLFFLPLAMTDPLEEHLPDLRYDITQPLISSIYQKMLQLSSIGITKFWTKWITYNQPYNQPVKINPKIIGSENISFSTFKFNDRMNETMEVIWLLYLDPTKCVPVNVASIANNQKDESGTKYQSVIGNVKFLHKNDTKSCQTPIEMYLFRQKVNIQVFGNKDLSEKQIRAKLIFGSHNIFHGRHNCEYYSHFGELVSIEKNISKIVTQRITECIELHAEPAIKFVRDDYPQINNKFRDKRENYYVYFKLDRYTDIFPWIHDYEEFMIRGLNDVHHLEIDFSEKGEGTIKIYVQNVTLFRSFTSTSASVTHEQLDIDETEYEIYWSGNVNNDLSINNLEINIINKAEVQTSIVSNEEWVIPYIFEKFRVDTAEKIKQIPQDLPKDYFDIKVAKTITKILQPFDKKSFGTLFIGLEKTTNTTLLSETIQFSTIALKEFSRLETISCLSLDNAKIGTVDYQQIIAQAEFSRAVNEKNIRRISISSKVYIENATVHISVNRNSNSTKHFEVNIEDTFDISNSMVMIDSGNYYLTKENRTEIGKQIFDQFAKTIKDQVINTTNFMLDPILEVCDNSPGKAIHNTSERFFASVYDRWDNATKAVNVIINGRWNYKLINIRYINENIIVGGLRVENVTVNIKQFDDSKETVSSSYSYLMEHILLTIKHTNKDVQVNIPRFAELRTNASITFNTTASDHNKSNMMENLELTIASFVEQSIYGEHQNYYDKFRNLVAKEMRKTIEEYASHNEASSQFTLNFVNMLVPIVQYNRDSFIYQELANGILQYFEEKFRWQIDFLNLTILPHHQIYACNSDQVNFHDTFSREEICDYLNHSLVQFHIKNAPMRITGVLEFRHGDPSHSVRILYSININQTKLSYNCIDETLKIECGDENIQVRLTDGANKFIPNLNATYQDAIEKNLAQNISSTFASQLVKISSKVLSKSKYSLFCGIPQEIIDKKGSIFSKSSENDFYSINGTTEYTSRRFLKYYIRIYGLQNIKTVSTLGNPMFTEFEFKLANLTARILWSYYMGGLVSKKPVLKVINLQIDEILLAGKFERIKRVLDFGPASRVKFRNLENLWPTEKLKYTLEPIILKSIQQSITNKFRVLLPLRHLFRRAHPRMYSGKCGPFQAGK